MVSILKVYVTQDIYIHIESKKAHTDGGNSPLGSMVPEYDQLFVGPSYICLEATLKVFTELQ